MEKQPIEELKDVVSMVIQIVDAAYLSGQDGKLEWDDLTHIFGLMKAIGPALAGISQVPGEISDLSVEECNELCQMINEELTVPDAKQKEILAKSLACLKSCYEVYLAIRGE